MHKKIVKLISSGRLLQVTNR